MSMSTSLRWMRVIAFLAAAAHSLCAAAAAQMEVIGWTNASPRDEIRPAFTIKQEGGPHHLGSLVIRSEDNTGSDGHWSKAFPVTGGDYYSFRVLRHLENVE